MKVILYMEITANGYIAKENHDTSWISEQAWKSYRATMQKMDAIIIGKHTYDIMPSDEFEQQVLYIVMTHNTDGEKKVPTVEFTAASPQEIITDLEKKGIRSVCIAGGGAINSQFMQAGLVQEIYVDIEPIILGKGIRLFSEADFEYKLQLLDSKKLNKNTMQLHYKVL